MSSESPVAQAHPSINQSTQPQTDQYPTELPKTFPIGDREVAPFVTVSDLQAHLRLLGAFSKLKQKVEQLATDPYKPEEAWVVFVNKAVDRFYKLLRSSWNDIDDVPTSSEKTIPPLDVLLVWHAYLLNPRHYYEDGLRGQSLFRKNLRTLASMPLNLIAQHIDPTSFEPTNPSQQRKEWFEKLTGSSYEPILDVNPTELAGIRCPRCSAYGNYPWWTSTGSGYGQPNFKGKCSSCEHSFTRQMLGMRRFCDDAMLRIEGQKVYFSETLLDPDTGGAVYKKSDKLCDLFVGGLYGGASVPKSVEDSSKEAARIARDFGWHLKTLAREIAAGATKEGFLLKASSPIIYRIMTAYSHPGLASIELVGAVLRQGEFIDKMVNMGWATPERFESVSNLAPLVRSVARYHAFLWLMAKKPKTLFVPTLDIDLVWHTHQLNAESYRDDTLSVLGRTPNHEDSIQQSILSDAFDMTAQEWKSAFDVPYTVCGCFPSHQEELGRLDRLKLKILPRNKQEKAESGTIVNSRPDLISTESEDATGSHPSEHNAIGRDQKEIKETVKQQAKNIESARHSKTCDPWTRLQLQRFDGEENQKHQHAFSGSYTQSDHYSYWGISMPPPFGFYGGQGYQGVASCGGGSCGGGCGGGGCGGGKYLA